MIRLGHMSESVGKYIRERREAAGVSQGHVAREMGLSVPYLSDVERGNRNIVQARWGALARAIPGLDLRELARICVDSGPVEVDARGLSDAGKRAIVRALVQAAEESEAA